MSTLAFCRPYEGDLYQHKHYIGYYDKQTRATSIAKPDDMRPALIDDLDGERPLHSIRWHVNQAGELAVLLSPKESEEMTRPAINWRVWFPWLFGGEIPKVG